MCFIHQHCLTLVRVATFTRLAPLLDGHYKIQPVPPVQRHIILNTRLHECLPYMTQMRIPEGELVGIHRMMVEMLIRVVTKSASLQKSISADGTRIDLGLVDVHPECVLTTYHKNQIISKMFPYVGTSKVPCRGCQCYIDSFSNDMELFPPQFNYRYDRRDPLVVCFPWAAPLIEPVSCSGGLSSIDRYAMDMMTRRNLKGVSFHSFDRLRIPEGSA